MKAIETTATLTANDQLTLDQPIILAHQQRVRVIILISETEEDPDDTPMVPDRSESIETIREGLYQGWQDVLKGNTKPVSQLWEGMDVD